MKFITVRDLRTHPAKVRKELPKNEEMIITSNGRPFALLTAITGDDLEETLKNLRKIKAIKSVERMQQISHKKGNNKLSLKEINQIIRKARKSKLN